ncbi:hypothetical protein NC651_035317 [Populus alba x Populus x berolinensis]|nr:hypothetical protein NC651_035317 [Populus alba x Populus x berolinensis]
MTKLPNIVIIIDQQEEYMDFQECITLGITEFCLINIIYDPNLTNISIPVNDNFNMINYLHINICDL